MKKETRLVPFDLEKAKAVQFVERTLKIDNDKRRNESKD